jgi:hypothetical protein
MDHLGYLQTMYSKINLRILYLIPITLGFDIANDTVVIMQDTSMLLI